MTFIKVTYDMQTSAECVQQIWCVRMNRYMYTKIKIFRLKLIYCITLVQIDADDAKKKNKIIYAKELYKYVLLFTIYYLYLYCVIFFSMNYLLLLFCNK